MTTLAIANSPGHGMLGSHPEGDYTLPGQVFLSSTDVPPESLVYGLAIEVGDLIEYNVSAVSDSGDLGSVVIDSLGVPTIAGPVGMYEITATWTNQATGIPVEL